MKILSLLELIQPQVSTAKYSGKFRREREADDSSKFIGGGSFSNVKHNPKDPHTVIKNNRTPLGDKVDFYDGFETFAKVVVENKLYENPHFPRIYVSKKIVDRDGNHINKYEIEKLVNHDELSEEEVAAVCDTFFDLPESHYDTFNMALAIGVAITDRQFGGLQSEQLIEACKIVRQIADTYSNGRGADIVFLDIKEANIMFRRGPTGLTPVINDPFA